MTHESRAMMFECSMQRNSPRLIAAAGLDSESQGVELVDKGEGKQIPSHAIPIES